MPVMFNSCSNDPLDIDIKCRDISSSHFLADLYKEVVKKHDEIIIQTLTNLLKREPTEEDFKKCAKIYLPGEHMNYTLAYESINLGYVNFIFEEVKVTITFTPCRNL